MLVVESTFRLPWGVLGFLRVAQGSLKFLRVLLKFPQGSLEFLQFSSLGFLEFLRVFLGLAPQVATIHRTGSLPVANMSPETNENLCPVVKSIPFRTDRGGRSSLEKQLFRTRHRGQNAKRVNRGSQHETEKWRGPPR